MTTSFIQQYPEVIIAIMVMLVAILGWVIKESFNRLTTAISSLESSITRVGVDIGQLNVRLIAVETTCQMQRQRCPMHPKDPHPYHNHPE